MVERAANDPGPVPDLDCPDDGPECDAWAVIPGEEPRPTDVEPLTPSPTRPRRGELHGADDPRGFFANRGASWRTVRREK